MKYQPCYKITKNSLLCTNDITYISNLMLTLLTSYSINSNTQWLPYHPNPKTSGIAKLP